MKLPTLTALTAVLLMGCTRLPDDQEVFIQSVQAIDQYLHTNAVAAEAIMLEQERYFRQAEKDGYRGNSHGALELNAAYAMTYSRLYLVEKALGKADEAKRYYQLAEEYWPKANKLDRSPDTRTPQTVREQIEGVDRYLGSADWEAQVVNKPQ